MIKTNECLNMHRTLVLDKELEAEKLETTNSLEIESEQDQNNWLLNNIFHHAR